MNTDTICLPTQLSLPAVSCLKLRYITVAARRLKSENKNIILVRQISVSIIIDKLYTTAIMDALKYIKLQS